MKYIVINADIKNSRKKHFMKEDFDDKIKQLNSELCKEIIVDFSIIKGDEIQGVINKNANVFKFIRKLKHLFLPFELRIGIGIGTIYKEDDIKKANNSWELNGEAFFNARDAVDFMKENKGKKTFLYNVFFKTGNKILDNRISLVYSYVDEILCKWKKDFFNIIFFEEDGYKHEEIAFILKNKDNNILENIDIKKERINITKKISRSNWYKVKQTENMLLEMMKEGTH